VTENKYKPCSYCKQEFPATTEYFYKASNQSSGLSPRCKDCVSLTTGRKRREKPPVCLPGFQQCLSCKRILPQSEEYFEFMTKTFRKKCKQCRVEANRLSVANNPGTAQKYNERVRLKRKDPIEGDKMRKRDRNYRDAHLEEKRASDRKRRALGTIGHEKQTAKKRNYYWKNRDTILEKNRGKSHADREAKRRARINGLPYDWEKADWQRCLEYWGHKCCICGRGESDTHFIARDHWIAVKDYRPDNPGTVPHNIVPLCHSYRGRDGEPGCNNHKHKHDPVVWLCSKYPPDEAERIIARIHEYFEAVKR
jgi:hypothetical protein